MVLLEINNYLFKCNNSSFGSTALTATLHFCHYLLWVDQN